MTREEFLTLIRKGESTKITPGMMEAYMAWLKDTFNWGKNNIKP